MILVITVCLYLVKKQLILQEGLYYYGNYFEILLRKLKCLYDVNIMMLHSVTSLLKIIPQFLVSLLSICPFEMFLIMVAYDFLKGEKQLN
jgi:hypothetical protein